MNLYSTFSNLAFQNFLSFTKAKIHLWCAQIGFAKLFEIFQRSSEVTGRLWGIWVAHVSWPFAVCSQSKYDFCHLLIKHKLVVLANSHYPQILSPLFDNRCTWVFILRSRVTHKRRTWFAGCRQARFQKWSHVWHRIRLETKMSKVKTTW